MPTMHEFCQRHRHTKMRSAERITSRWEREAELDGLLGTPIATGLTLGDLLVGDGLRDQVSPELLDAFHALMGEKAATYDQVRRILLDRLEDGQASVLGIINKIKGQVGENWFLQEAQAAGLSARLAESGSQEAWDIAIDHPASTQYVQVKTSGDPSHIVSQIEAVQEKLQDPGRVLDGDLAVTAIDFAVPSDTVAAVETRLAELDIHATVLAMPHSAAEAAAVVETGVNNVGPEAVSHLFGQLLGAGVTAGALHGLVNAFLVYKGAKDASMFLGDTVTSASLTASGIAAGMGVEAVLGKLAIIGGVPTYALVLGTSITTRCMLQRVLSRKGYVEWLGQQNQALRQQVETCLAGSAAG